MKGFWRVIKNFGAGFVSQDNSKTNTPYAAMFWAFLLATPIVCLACSIIITHFYIRGKPLDAPTVDLLKYLLGAATGIVFGAGASVFSRTTLTNITGLGPGPIAKANPAPPEKGD